MRHMTLLLFAIDSLCFGNGAPAYCAVRMGDKYTNTELAKHEVNAACVLGINTPQLCLYPLSHCLQGHRQHLSAHAQFNNTDVEG